MAIIAVKIDGISGECTHDGCADHVDAIGIRESVEASMGSPARGGGRGRASDLELIRYSDSASPKLWQACSAAENLGEIDIQIFQTAETGVVPYMVYNLVDVYVSRIERETLDEGNVGFQPHMVPVTRGQPAPGGIGMMSALAPAIADSQAGTRLMPTGAAPTGNRFTSRELERVFLNVSAILWAYTPYKDGVKSGGVIEATFNLRAGKV